MTDETPKLPRGLIAFDPLAPYRMLPAEAVREIVGDEPRRMSTEEIDALRLGHYPDFAQDDPDAFEASIVGYILSENPDATQAHHTGPIGFEFGDTPPPMPPGAIGARFEFNEGKPFHVVLFGQPNA
ncbi:MAG: hypothetical protein QNJ13_17420 [Paracoccaceae bacterium]|nr:hypothetical protein [Paracoccaceae bacterium]